MKPHKSLRFIGAVDSIGTWSLCASRIATELKEALLFCIGRRRRMQTLLIGLLTYLYVYYVCGILRFVGLLHKYASDTWHMVITVMQVTVNPFSTWRLHVYTVSVHTLILTETHTITAYSVSGNVVRVRILICTTRRKPCRKRVYRTIIRQITGLKFNENKRQLGLTYNDC